MAEEQTAQERTEQPTPKRRHDAKERGDVARSRELTTVALLVASSGMLLFMGGHFIRELGGALARSLSIPREAIFDPYAGPRMLVNELLQAIADITPILALTAVIAMLAPLALGGWVFSGKAIAPKFERLDPVKGLGRAFGKRGLAEMAKALAKFLLLAGVAVTLIWTDADRLLAMGRGDLQQSLAEAGWMIGRGFLIASAATLLIAAVDVPFQIHSHNQKLRMSRQEVREEMKETDGRPEVKARIRGIQQELARRRMMEEVPKADVIVTNPTHYAVALKYDPDRMGAPRVVAKGADEVATRIRAVGEQHGVSLLSAPPLARALYHSTKIGQEIPAGLYLSVAQVLAYVFQLRRHRAGEPMPVPPAELPIPDEFRIEAAT